MKSKSVFALVDRGTKKLEVLVGSGVEHPDGSIVLVLEALPSSGRVVVRDALVDDISPEEVEECALAGVRACDGAEVQPMDLELARSALRGEALGPAVTPGFARAVRKAAAEILRRCAVRDEEKSDA